MLCPKTTREAAGLARGADLAQIPGAAERRPGSRGGVAVGRDRGGAQRGLQLELAPPLVIIREGGQRLQGVP